LPANPGERIFPQILANFALTERVKIGKVKVRVFPRAKKFLEYL